MVIEPSRGLSGSYLLRVQTSYTRVIRSPHPADCPPERQTDVSSPPLCRGGGHYQQATTPGSGPSVLSASSRRGPGPARAWKEGQRSPSEGRAAPEGHSGHQPPADRCAQSFAVQGGQPPPAGQHARHRHQRTRRPFQEGPGTRARPERRPAWSPHGEGRQGRRATQGISPWPETAPAYLLRLDPEAVQPGCGRAGDAARGDLTSQGRLQEPPYGCPGVSAPATRKSLGGAQGGRSDIALQPLLPRLRRPASSICDTGCVAAHTLRRLGTGSAPVTHESSRLPPDRGEKPPC
ncbi:hypothetical protein NDU88_001684 [Pleurodeles waltl]|uniref:Uncharacterized protein n=1 Tax=Pleurodeles waltl TaxID=8319 RepID=A0AAV7LAG9_PLEWA|nr:hypothetical protein NDU88_001684 [Pleurodeles waltl]